MEKPFECLSRDKFDVIFSLVENDKNINANFIYICYKSTIDSMNSIDLPYTYSLNHLLIISYLINEHLYFLQNGEINENNYEKNEEYAGKLISTSIDKYYINEVLSGTNKNMSNKFNPPYSSLHLYLNYLNEIISKLDDRQPEKTLIIDLLKKAFSFCNSILLLLENKYETVAFSTWRSLHEVECITILINKYKNELSDQYVKHLHYSEAFKLHFDKQTTDKIFVQIKEEMAALNLKSKDIKRYIEYGWISHIPGVDLESLKFNFRDGVEFYAGLSNYSKTYELSSETTHNSPLQIYSNEEYFKLLTVINLYESFFRIENIFYDNYEHLANDSDFLQYKSIRKNYYYDLTKIHRFENEKLKKMI